MLATAVREPFHRPGWSYEEKYDGDRILAYKEKKQVRLFSRNAIDRTDRFPHVAEAVRRLHPPSLLLDGEMVVFDAQGVSRFQLLQQGRGKPVYAVFDCLFKDGVDLRPMPLSRRRAVLEASVRPGPSLLRSRLLAENGFEAFRLAEKRGYEGLVAKDLALHYVSGRSSSWLKVKAHREDEFVIAGFTQPRGSRQHFGALLLGAYEGPTLHYVGKVGTGFDARRLEGLYRKFRPLIRAKSSLAEPPRERGATFLAPKLVAQIAYREWTADGKLRQPVFLGLRDDKSPREVALSMIR